MDLPASAMAFGSARNPAPAICATRKKAAIMYPRPLRSLRSRFGSKCVLSSALSSSVTRRFPLKGKKYRVFNTFSSECLHLEEKNEPFRLENA